MQVTLEIHNTRTIIHCDLDARIIVNDVLTYPLPGSEHIQSAMSHKAWSWDGQIRLLKRDNSFPTGLVKRVARSLLKAKYRIVVDDQREKPTPDQKFNLDLPSFLVPRYYQNDCAILTDKKQRGIFLIGTGGGKSLIMAMICMKRAVQVLVCTPDTGIREQLFKDFVEWFGSETVSKDIKSNKPIVISNIQSLVRKDKKDFEQFRMLMTDEFHHSASKSYTKLNELAKNCFYRYGFTGTNLRTDGTEMTMRGVLSEVLCEKTTSDLIEEGFLVAPKINIHIYPLFGYSKLNWNKAYNKLVLDEEFNLTIANLAREEIDKGKQVLILVRLKPHGEMLKILLRDQAAYLSGDDSVEYRDEQKDLFNRRIIPCIIATSVLGEGQNIPNIDVFINARLQKSEIQTRQGIGRALRKSEGKTEAIVHDFLIERNASLNEHSVERIMQYKSERAFKVIVK